MASCVVDGRTGRCSPGISTPGAVEQLAEQLHGVGLEVHERPGVGRVESEPLVEGDVIALEPGLYRHGYGGVRLEDLVLVTADGAELLTHYPYDFELA